MFDKFFKNLVDNMEEAPVIALLYLCNYAAHTF